MLRASQRNLIWALLLSLAPFSVFSAEELRSDEGKSATDPRTYTEELVGWRITVPNGWDLVEPEETKELQEKGTALLEEVAEEEMDISKLKNLLSFRKGKFNLLQSTAEPFAEEYEGEWEENNLAVTQLILDAYKSQGLKVEKTVNKEVISGVEFEKLSLVVDFPQNGMRLRQIIFSALINGYCFSVNINFLDKALGETMLAAFRESRFEVAVPERD